MVKKIKKLNKKTLAIILIVLTLISSIVPIVKAVYESGQWIGAQYSSGHRTTSSSGSGGMLIRRLQNRSTSEKYTVFCAEYRNSISDWNLGEWYSIYTNRPNN